MNILRNHPCIGGPFYEEINYMETKASHTGSTGVNVNYIFNIYGYINRRSTARKHTAIKCKINSTLARVMLPVMGNDIPTPIPRDIEGETRRTQLYGALSLTKHDSFQKLMGNDCSCCIYFAIGLMMFRHPF